MRLHFTTYEAKQNEARERRLIVLNPSFEAYLAHIAIYSAGSATVATQTQTLRSKHELCSRQGDSSYV